LYSKNLVTQFYYKLIKKINTKNMIYSTNNCLEKYITIETMKYKLKGCSSTLMMK
jgi:hypothetical protein